MFLCVCNYLCLHFFLYFFLPVYVKVMDALISRHATRLLKLRVDEIEVKARIANGEDGKGQVIIGLSLCEPLPLRRTTC